MKKIASKTVAIFVCAIIIFTSITPAFAFCTASLLTNSINGTNWMSGIKDDTKLCDISIPGTHDSGSKNVSIFTETWAKTQNHTIATQLEDGMRYFDMRLEHALNVTHNAQVVHGSIDCMNESGSHLSLDEVLQSMYSFLNQHPTETILVSMKQDDGDDINALANDINTMINLNPNYWYTGSSTPTLGAVRGKCVLISRINQIGRGIGLSWGDQGSDGGAVDYSWMKAQDRYNMGVWNKWSNAVKPLLDEQKPNGKWFVNFLSTTGGGIAGVPSTSSEMNQYFREYETLDNKCYGLVVVDYGTADIAKKVYKCNDLVTKNQPNNSNGQYYYRLNLNVTENVAKGWTYVKLILYYKENNGRGAERSITLFQNGDAYDGYYFTCTRGNYDFSGMLNGFPSKIVFQYSWSNGNDDLGITFKGYVGALPTLPLTQCMEETYYERSTTGERTYYFNSSAAPVPSELHFRSSNEAIVNVPDINSNSTNTYTFNCDSYDQYGVRWYERPAIVMNVSYPGITLSENVLSVTKAANDLPNNTIFYLYGNQNGLTSPGKKVVINTNPIPYRFVNYDGTVLQEGTAYAGSTPVYSNPTPTKPYDSTGHYIFSGWAPSGTLSTTNNTYTATYSKTAHMRASTEITQSATCTEDGYNTNYCLCGYSWTTPTSATGHSIVTRTLSATCTENGYNRQVCEKCDHIESEEILEAFGHDTENAVRGEYVSATQSHNGYVPSICPVCNQEIVELRDYDNTDWSAYYDALKMISDIKEYDSDYNNYDNNAKADLDEAVESAREIENSEQTDALQSIIDSATESITNAVQQFSNAINVEYYTLTFVYENGTHTTLTLKSGTNASDIQKPNNTPTVVTSTKHTIYRWPVMNNVSKNIIYKENAATSNHTYGTFIFPDSEFAPTCTEYGFIRHTCLCGYHYDENKTSPIGHLYDACVSNGDGTHNRICANNQQHILTEECTVNPQTHRCVVCNYELDLSTYYAILIVVETEMSNTEKYSQDSLNTLQTSLNDAKKQFNLSTTQQDIDNIVFDLQSAISELQLRELDVMFYYVTDEDYATSIKEYCGTYHYGDEVTFVVSSSICDNAVITKWTAENTETGVTQNLLTNQQSITAVLNSNMEYVVYLSTDDSNPPPADNYSMLTITDLSGRTTDVIYIKNGTYTIREYSSYIILSGESSEMEVVRAKMYPFYDFDCFTVNGTPLTTSIEINGNITLVPKYV